MLVNAKSIFIKINLPLRKLRRCTHGSAAKYIRTKLKVKLRVSSESFAIRKKRDVVKTSHLCNKRNPTNANAQKLKKAQTELKHSRKNKENIFKTKSIRLEPRLDIDDLKSLGRLNKVYKRMRTSRGKRKATRKEDLIHIWKSPKYTD